MNRRDGYAHAEAAVRRFQLGYCLPAPSTVDSKLRIFIKYRLSAP